MPVSEKSCEQVYDDELLEIRKRRKVHASEESKSARESSTVDESYDDLTGLALSGGGVRSAAFSLGFIQALYSAGRMKGFDFLSTVSGGGYAGGLFSSTVTRHKGDVNWDREGHHSRLDFEPLPEGGQPDSVRRLALYGRMMGDFVRLFSRHFWGFLVNVTIAVSGLVAIAAVLAYLMRIPWNRDMLPVLSELGFQNDISLSFFCTFLAALIWLLSHMVMRAARAFKKEIAPITQYTYLFLLASLLLGLLTMLAIGDIDIGKMFAGEGKNLALEQSVNRMVQWIGLGISGLFATSLLPYLSPKRLLQSGQANANRVQSIIFRAASNALVLGAPLFVYFFLVHENISGWNSSRPDADQLSRAHLSSPTAFAAKLESQVTSLVPERERLARKIYNALNDSTYTDVEFEKSSIEMKNELESIRKLGEQKELTDRRYGFGSRCMQWLTDTLRVSDTFSSRVEAQTLSGKNHDVVLRRFNKDVLSDPSLFVSLLKGSAEESVKEKAGVVDLGKGDVAIVESSQQLLRKLGLPVSIPKPSDDNRLELALESLRGAQTQWNHRYRKSFACSSKQEDSNSPQDSDPWTLALMSLVNDQVDSTVITESVENRDGKVNNVKVEIKAVDGSVVSALDALLADGKGDLQLRLESKFGSFGVDSDIGEQPEAFRNWKAKHAIVAELTRKVRESNWLLLNQLYPQHVRAQDTIFAFTVNGADQAYRLKLAGYATVVFLLVGLLSNLNSTSLHGVYRDQLADVWLPDHELRLHQLETCDKGAPLHLINATVNRMGHRYDPDIEGRSRFLLSHRFCGTKKIGYRETKQYERGSLSVADAMAISGGAVTAVNAPSVLHQLILFMTNFRLGQWLANPVLYELDHYWPSPIRTMLNMLWHPEQRSYLFISDGGHIDNTGLAALMERRCRLMVCVDASHDENYEFTDLLRLLHSARAKYGIRADVFDYANKGVDLSTILDELRPGAYDRSRQHFVAFSIQYPDVDTPSLLIYCKPTVAGGEPIEIVERARLKDHFPHDPTSDQFLPPEVFDSYLVLGRHIGEVLDRFVSDGHIDSFDLGQGWHSSGVPQTVNPQRPSETDLARRNEELALPTLPQIQHTLNKVTFDDAGVSAVVEILDAWREATLNSKSRPDSRIDTSVIEIVSPWAQELGPAASLKLRRKLCTTLITHVDLHVDVIRSDRTLRAHYRNMLQALGSGVPYVARTLKKLVKDSSRPRGG